MVSQTRRALLEQVPRDHQQPDSAFRRRRIVVAITLVIGAVLLWRSLSVRPGDSTFYPLATALAATWVVGGFASGPLHLGWIATGSRLRRPVLTPLAIGVLSALVFVLGALVVREIGPLRDITDRVLAHARAGSVPLIALLTLVNGVAEEIFFRGALYAAIGRKHAVLLSTVLYTLATVATGNVMLVFAAAVLGCAWALQRRASGGILAPMISHVTWSAAMVFILPPLFAH